MYRHGVPAEVRADPGEVRGVLRDRLRGVGVFVAKDPCERGEPFGGAVGEPDRQLTRRVQAGGHVAVIEGPAELDERGVRYDYGAVGGLPVAGGVDGALIVRGGAEGQEDGDHRHDDDGDDRRRGEVPEAHVVLYIHEDEPELALVPPALQVVSAVWAERDVVGDVLAAVRTFHGIRQ